jgi:hypothetical protein
LHIYNDDGGNGFIWNLSILLPDYMVTCTWSYCRENWKSVMVPYLCDEIWLWYKICACWVDIMALWTYIYIAFNTVLCLTHRGAEQGEQETRDKDATEECPHVTNVKE